MELWWITFCTGGSVKNPKGDYFSSTMVCCESDAIKAAILAYGDDWARVTQDKSLIEGKTFLEQI